MARPNTDPYVIFKRSTLIPETGCWEWAFAKNKKGYGQFRVKGKLHITHRLAWSLWYKQEIPKRMHVLHTVCDNPPCINPEHLVLGTNDDNVREKMEKKRHTCFRKTHFSCGHPLEGNTRVNNRAEGISRSCLICDRERVRRHQSTPEFKVRRNARLKALRDVCQK